MSTTNLSVHVELNHKPNKLGQYRLFIRCKLSGKLPIREKVPYCINLSDWNVKMKNGKAVLTKAGNPVSNGCLEKANWVKSTNPNAQEINEYLRRRIMELSNQVENAKKESRNTAKTVIQEDDFLPFFLKKLEEHKRINEFTYLGYYKAYLLLSKYCGGKLPYSTVTPDFVEAFIEHSKNELVYGRPRKAVTIRTYLSTIKRYYGKAVEEKLALYNPFEVPRISESRVKKPKKITFEQVQHLMYTHECKTIPSREFEAIHTFLLCFFARGMRVKDAMELQWSDVKEDHIAYYPSKTKRIQKKLIVPITPPLRIILNRYKEHAHVTGGYVTLSNYYYPPKPEKESVSSNPIASAIIHTNAHHKKVIIYNRILAKIAKLNKWDIQFSTHSARHSFIDYIYRQTKDVYKASRAAGHSSVAMTERYIEDLSAHEVKETLEELFK